MKGLRVIRGVSGFTLTEVLIGMLLAVLVFASILGSMWSLSLMSEYSKKRIQAIEVVRGGVERLKTMAFDDIQTMGFPNTAFDAGADNVFGTADDVEGTLRFEVTDFADMDQDGNTQEAAIDLDGDNTNDCVDAACDTPYAKPVRVTFEWQGRAWGQDHQYSTFIDVLIAR